MSHPDRDQAMRAALASIAARSQLAARLDLGSGEAVLRSIVEAAAAIFDAEAASLALYRADRSVLQFVVAAGEQGSGVVGREIAPDQGLAGYVFSSGQAVAIADVAADARFGQAFAQSTGYVPRSIVAVPLLDDAGTIGVLEVLDKRTEAAFSLRDVEMAGVFARQATIAIRASRVERDTATLIRNVIGRLAVDGAGAGEGAAVEAAAIEALVAEASAALTAEDDPIWPLVEQIAAIRLSSPEQLELVAALLEALAAQSSRTRAIRGRAGSSRGRTFGRPVPSEG